MSKLYYAGMPGDGSGWGVCNANLIRELSKLTEVTLPDVFNAPEHKWTAKEWSFTEHVVFQPLEDHDFNPANVEGMSVRGWKNFAYTFFEYDLGPKAARNAKDYDIVFCGSTWCLDRMKERGITNGKVLVQGVDHSVFHPGPSRPKDGQFWIFSGGKFEYRKGQDLVLAAFKEISKRHPNARLITAWQNPWPQLLDTMVESKHIKFELRGQTWGEQLGHICDINGIDKTKVRTLPGIIPNKNMADIYRQCDLGLFPNRCEGGTNLVMMEFMACGRPVAASHLTGHADVWGDGMLPLGDTWGAHNWAEYDLPLMVDWLEHWLGAKDRPKYPEKWRRHVDLSLKEYGAKAAEAMQKWTWERAARTIFEDV